MFDSVRRALQGDPGRRAEELRAELVRLEVALEERRTQLEERRRERLQALFPAGPVPGHGPARYPDLAPLNFEDSEGRSWLVEVASRVIDGFPGGEALLSQLDASWRAFAEANYYRVARDGPWSELLTWRDEVLHSWDLPLEVPLFVSTGGGNQVLGCAEPFLVLDRFALLGLEPAEQRFLLATSLGHVFFGNLKIFSFHRLMEVMDRVGMAGVTGLVTRGLGMIPGIGNTISRGIELARTLNNQVIRKTNLLVGLRQHILCDRLALLASPPGEGAAVAQRFLARTILGSDGGAGDAVRERLIAQGRVVHERFERGEIDPLMLSVVGPPGASFAAYRAYKLEAWVQDERSQRIGDGYYVTRARLADYQRDHQKLEEQLRFLEARVVELAERQVKAREELMRLEAEAAQEDVGS